jgi:glyoxylase-like metal-dependent hydrolase (beta-lactamase superfamily II)
MKWTIRKKLSIFYLFMEFGDYRIEVIPDSEFRLDGGAMFGVVPRVLWERVSPADELNRVTLNMNCVFIETPSEKVILETGIGEKWSERETQMFGIRRNKSFGESLRERTGYSTEDISIVVNTHLHFDHAGGNTIDVEGSCKPQFPNARYLVSKEELKHAKAPHERDRASYLLENWEPVIDSGQVEMMSESYEVIPGLTVSQVRGHSETMQTWRLDRSGQTLYGFADLIPTRHHVRPAWIMAYDLFPTETLAFKKEILPKVAAENWHCLFYHDAEHPICKITESDGKFEAVPVTTN